MSRYLIVGLGNPGTEYAATRHNIGFMVIERLAARHGMRVTTKKFRGLIDTGSVYTESVLLLQPQTYMNRSGGSVQPAQAFYDIEPEKIIVVHDELDLDLGALRVKVGGGHGGHNGLRDIIAKIGTRDFIRVRVGIGRPRSGDVSSYVLGAFAKSEQNERDEMIEVSCDALEEIVRQGVVSAQNQFNRT